ncbi:11008_t:CDS:2, partial [Racocetra fulgida]
KDPDEDTSEKVDSSCKEESTFLPVSSSGSLSKDDSLNCDSKITTKSPTGNIINHLATIHQIFKNTFLPNTVIKKLLKSKSRILITQKQQKYLESLLYEWIILDNLPLQALESFSSRHFINNLNLDFNILSNKRFKNKIFESRSYVSQKEESTNESQLVLYHILTDCETRWLSTFYAWDRLLTLKLFIDILSTAMNVKNVDYETKKDGKHLEKINLASKEWSIIEDIMPILGQFTEAIEKLEGNELDDAFKERQIEDDIKENESKAKRKIKINNPINTFGLIDTIKSKLYRVLNYYYNDLKLDGLVASLLDPRWKSLLFITEQKKSETINELRRLYENEKSKYHVTNLPERQESKPSHKKQKKTKLYGESLFSSFSSNLMQQITLSI